MELGVRRYQKMSINANGITNTDSEVLIENEDELDAAINSESVYPMNHIKVEKGFYSVFELKRKFDSKSKKIILDSDFQRESVWKPIQKSELIESILMGLPLPIFYFNEDKKGRLIVIDGRQRLTALFEYLDNDFPLGRLKVLPELAGKRFSALDAITQSIIEDYQIQAHVIQPPTPDRIKFDIFDRVNRAGTQLNKQEIRNALYQGNSTMLLINLSKREEFSAATDSAFCKNSRMKDRYIILRYLAFSLYFNKKLTDDDNTLYEYKNDIDDLLGRAMDYLNSCDDEEISVIRKRTIACLKNAYYYLGENGFRLIKNGKKSPINMNVFECLMYLMSKLPMENSKIKNTVKVSVNRMLKDEVFLDSIGNHRDNWVKIERRFDMADYIAAEVIEND